MAHAESPPGFITRHTVVSLSERPSALGTYFTHCPPCSTRQARGAVHGRGCASGAPQLPAIMGKVGMGLVCLLLGLAALASAANPSPSPANDSTIIPGVALVLPRLVRTCQAHPSLDTDLDRYRLCMCLDDTEGALVRKKYVHTAVLTRQHSDSDCRNPAACPYSIWKTHADQYSAEHSSKAAHTCSLNLGSVSRSSLCRL